LQKQLGNIFLSRVELEDSIRSLPDDTYDKERGQYSAEKLIEYLDRTVSDYPADKIIAVTNADMYAKELNFVFGIAQKGGKLAAISLYRLDQRFYGKKSKPPTLRERAVKEAVHEIGHTLGLDHCSNEACVMSFSNDIMSVDQKEKFFCEECREKVRHRL
jgi:archaemetzincin